MTTPIIVDTLYKSQFLVLSFLFLILSSNNISAQEKFDLDAIESKSLDFLADYALKLAESKEFEDNNNLISRSNLISNSRDEPKFVKHMYVKFTQTTEELGRLSNRNLRAFKTLLDLKVPRQKACKILLRRRSNFCRRPNLNCDTLTRFRTINGTCNNLNKPYWGTSFREFRRLLSHTYEDGYNEPRGGMETAKSRLPNARLISSTVHTDFINPDPTITNMFPQFGQFLDHDLSLTPEGDKRCCSTDDADCWPINISRDDPFYSRTKKPQTCMDFTRSTPYCFPTSSCIREQMNMLTSYLDASQVYGSDNLRASQLREYKGGRLRVNRENSQFLPTVKEVEEIIKEEIEFMGTYLGGDERVNEMPALTVMHTLFFREHNRIADIIAKSRANWGWNDDKIYEETRRIVIGEWQKIVHSEFLPILLGNSTMEKYKLSFTGEFTNYRPDMDSTIFHSFATAAFRIGHTFVNGLVKLMKGLEVVGSYNIRDNFFDSTQISQGNGSGYEMILSGLMTQNAQTYDSFITEDLSNFLLKDKKDDFGADLIARNLQRGRDHGLRPYTAYRELCKLPALTTWRQRPENILRDTWLRLQSIYNSPQDIDLFTGGISETSLPDALSGHTFNCLLAMQFERVMYGDRFFSTHRDQAGSFTKEQLESINRITLGDIICQNSNIQMTPRTVFKTVSDKNPWVSCKMGGRPYLNIESFLSESYS